MKTRRAIAVVTVGRSDYGIYRPLLKRLSAMPPVSLAIVAAGAHLIDRFGGSIAGIRADGHPIAAEVPIDLAPEASQSRTYVARAIAQGVTGFSRAFERIEPDFAVVLGDRFEMYAAAVAAYAMRIPLAHIHGGEATFGAFDEGFRHSITKLGNLHFPSTVEYASRVIQLGEEPWRISVAGALALDGLTELAAANRADSLAEVAAFAGFGAGGFALDPLLVTFHPATLEQTDPGAQARELLAALEGIPNPILLTLPNADPGSEKIRAEMERFAALAPRARLVANFGPRMYANALQAAAAMIGNSSSGLIEAPSFGLPAVNIGTRQDGRVRGRNVIDCPPGRVAIRAAIDRAMSGEFRRKARESPNPYHRPGASATVASRLATEPINARLMRKQFYDISGLTAASRPAANG